jgi:hypothetical protein
MLWRPGAADNLDQNLVPGGTLFDVYGAYGAASTGVPADDYGHAASVTTAAGHRVVRSAGMYVEQDRGDSYCHVLAGCTRARRHTHTHTHTHKLTLTHTITHYHTNTLTH